MPNILFSSEDWTKQANKLDAVEVPTCFNKHKHPEPKTFKDSATLREHTTICFDKGPTSAEVHTTKSGTRGRGRAQPQGN